MKIKPQHIELSLPKQNKRKFERIQSKLNIPSLLARDNRIKKADVKFKQKNKIKKFLSKE